DPFVIDDDADLLVAQVNLLAPAQRQQVAVALDGRLLRTVQQYVLRLKGPLADELPLLVGVGRAAVANIYLGSNDAVTEDALFARADQIEGLHTDAHYPAALFVPQPWIAGMVVSNHTDDVALGVPKSLFTRGRAGGHGDAGRAGLIAGLTTG